MANRICIPDYEYKERIAKAAKLVAERGLDVMVVCSTESDYAIADECVEMIQAALKQYC